MPGAGSRDVSQYSQFLHISVSCRSLGGLLGCPGRLLVRSLVVVVVVVAVASQRGRSLPNRSKAKRVVHLACCNVASTPPLNVWEYQPP